MIEITISIEQTKLNAMNFYLGKSGSSVLKELQKRVAEIYEQTVPEPTREYLDFMIKPPPARTRARKPPKASAVPTAEPLPLAQAPLLGEEMQREESHDG